MDNLGDGPQPLSPALMLTAYHFGDRDFGRADLQRADLRDRILHGADLSGADLREANLSNVDLSDARLIGTRLDDANLSGANLSGSNLRNATMKNANLDTVDLSGANLFRTNFAGASLLGANLRQAKLMFTSLFYADLRDADLREADLDGADLRGATLRDAVLHGANLSGADLEGASLRELCTELTTSKPCRPIIGWQCVGRSLKLPNLQSLLTHFQMPALVATYLIDSLRSIDEMDLFTMLQTTFISYGGKDEAFARRLHQALEANGVKTWFFPLHAAAGQKIHREERRGINAYDRTILVCSESSLTRPGVLSEIERVLDKERASRTANSSVLIPIRLDDHVLESDEWIDADLRDYVQEIRGRVILDFSKASSFDESLSRLLAVLKKVPASL